MAVFCDIMSSTDTLDAEERAIETMKKELELKKKGLIIKQSSGDRSRYWIRYEGKMLKKTKKEDLIDELYALVFETVTMSRFWDSYLKDREAVVSGRTMYRSRYQYDRFIRGSGLDVIPIDKMTVADIKKWVRHCKEVKPDLSALYFRDIRSQLLGFARWVSEEKEIDVSTVLSYHPDMRLFRKKKTTPEEDAIFSAEEIAAVCAEVQKEVWVRKKATPLVIPLLFATGMRRGEALALRWSDVSTLPDGTGTISISRQLVREPEGWKITVIDHAKTDCGERTIKVRADVLELFSQIRAINRAAGCPAEDEDLIFMRKYRGRWQLNDPGVVYHYLEKFCKAAGMETVKSPHDIRRTALTQMYRAGMGIKAIQRYAGHKTVQQTYAYLRLAEEDIDISLLPAVVTDGNRQNSEKAV